MRYKPPSIKEEGLDNYLNRTAETHNGFGWNVFHKLAKSGLNETSLGKAFNVSRGTARKWLDIYREWYAHQKQVRADGKEALDNLKKL